MSSSILSVVWLAFYAVATYRLSAAWDARHRDETSNLSEAVWSGQPIRRPLSNYRRALFEESDDPALEHLRRLALLGLLGWLPIGGLIATFGPALDEQIGASGFDIARLSVSLVTLAIGSAWLIVLLMELVGPQRNWRRVAAALAGLAGAGFVFILVPPLV